MIEREQVHVIAQQKWHNLVDLVGVCVCVSSSTRTHTTDGHSMKSYTFMPLATSS